MPLSIDEESPYGWLGDYDHQDLAQSRWTARWSFLHAVEDLEPRVIKSLYDVAYALYVPLRDALDALNLLMYTGGTDFWRWPIGASAPESFGYTAAAPVRDAVTAWGHSWGLTDDWCLDRAVRTLSNWWVYRLPTDTFVPEDFRSFRGSDWMVTVLREAEEYDPRFQFTFTHRAWDPAEFPRSEIRKRIRDRFETSLTEYLDRMENLARDRGFVPSAHKVDRHFEWLALYQVGGRTPTQIAQQFGKERQAVDTAIRQTAALIDLTIRPLPHGGARPKRQSRIVVARRPKA